MIDSIAKFNEESSALDDIIKRLQDMQKRNNVLLKRYKGDEKSVLKRNQEMQQISNNVIKIERKRNITH